MAASLEDIVSLCKRRGFIYQGSEIYGGLSGTYDYGPLGVVLKRNMENLWWKMYVDDREDMYGLDSAILMNQKVWQASGHTETFADPLVECSNCKARFREDHLHEEQKAKSGIDMSMTIMSCPACGKAGTFGEAKQFNMMFKTSVGPVEDETSTSYLRPELAQGMFVNYKNVLDTFYPDLPFGLAQIGRTFRNEISPREFIFRVREFNLMELEYFVTADKWEKYFDHWHQQFYAWTDAIGLDRGKIKELDVPEADRAHYSTKTIDFEYKFSFGTKEIGAVAYRTDFDLSNHMKHSGVNMEYNIKGTNEKLIPHVIEPTFGLDRNLLAVISEAYTEDEVNGEQRIYLKLPHHLAPVKVAVSPLLKNKPELVNKAREVYAMLKKEFGNVMWDDNGNIGKRYRRQDEIGTPYCLTIDFDTLEDDTVTVRNRDTTEQTRAKISDLIVNLGN